MCGSTGWADRRNELANSRIINRNVVNSKWCAWWCVARSGVLGDKVMISIFPFQSVLSFKSYSALIGFSIDSL